MSVDGGAVQGGMVQGGTVHGGAVHGGGVHGGTVSVRVPTILRSYTSGVAEVPASAGTLREVIASLDAAYPGIAGRIIDENGKLRRFVNVYVAEEDVRFASGLDTPVPSGTQVSVIPAVAGG